MSTEPPVQTFVQWKRGDYRLHILPIVVGASISLILFGISLHMFSHVFKLMHERGTKYTRSWWVLMALFWISFGDTLNKFILFVNYMQSATLDGPLLFFKPVNRTIIATPIFQGILTVSVQLLYMYRILRIIRGMAKFKPSHHRARLITYGCLCVAGAFIIASLVGFVMAAMIETRPIVDFFPRLLVPGILALGCASTVDVILCLCMVYHLRQHKTISDFDKTSFMAKKFIKLTLETGLIPTVTQILELLLIIFKPRSGLWGAVGYSMTKVYVLAALVLYEAAFATNIASISHERGKSQPSRDNSKGRFHEQILVTETSVQQADVIEQSVQLRDVHPPRFLHEKEKQEETVSSLPSFDAI
ncbi:hypothetical protein BT69DRAFT_1321239 [Atractiella rhizophila]|nr:hypothetical protein BT69DRAFT_1321239 [Atractiella rhizophila]